MALPKHVHQDQWEYSHIDWLQIFERHSLYKKSGILPTLVRLGFIRSGAGSDVIPNALSQSFSRIRGKLLDTTMPLHRRNYVMCQQRHLYEHAIAGEVVCIVARFSRLLRWSSLNPGGASPSSQHTETSSPECTS